MNQPDAELIWDNKDPLPGDAKGVFAYHFQSGVASLQNETELRMMTRENIRPEESICRNFVNLNVTPYFADFKRITAQIEVFCSWSFGPLADIRRPQSTHDRGDFLTDGGENLPLVLSHSRASLGAGLMLVTALNELYEGIEDYKLPIVGGSVQLNPHRTRRP